jgi:cyclopropane-fatty-acyl-phospholipid synthase
LHLDPLDMSAERPIPAAVLEPSASRLDSGPRRPTSSLFSWLASQLARRLRFIPLRIELWNGSVLAPRLEPALATLELRRPRALLRILLDPVLGFGESYRAGEVDVKGNFVGALAAIFRRWYPEPARSREPRAPSMWALRSAGRGARHHYDLGNDFFRLWLDEQMVYTCAYFASPRLSLEEAQLAKMDYVCRKLRLQPGERVLEAGCGWGALARHMALQYGVHVTACNVSREQIRYARERATADGLGDRIRFVEDDFRNMRGSFDVFVSVGMLEHVGRRHYRALGRTIHDRLDRWHGRGLLHFIGRNRPAALNSWIRKRIFPNAHPPTLSDVFERVLEPWDFSVLDVENLRLHYAETLAHWLRRFEATADLATAMLDEASVRSWRLYLAGSQAAFAAGNLQLFQVLFSRGRDNEIPATRSSLYSEPLVGES